MSNAYCKRWNNTTITTTYYKKKNAVVFENATATATAVICIFVFEMATVFSITRIHYGTDLSFGLDKLVVEVDVHIW